MGGAWNRIGNHSEDPESVSFSRVQAGFKVMGLGFRARTSDVCVLRSVGSSVNVSIHDGLVEEISGM